MRDTGTPRTGIIECKQGIATFFADNYRFTVIKPDLNYRPTLELKPKDGFLYGKLHDGYSVAIHTGKNTLRVMTMGTIDTSTYIVSTNGFIDTDDGFFEGIEFRGGTLNNLFMPQAFDTDYANSGEVIIKPKSDIRTYEFAIGDSTCKMSIGSHSTDSHGIHGTRITNDCVFLRLEFSEQQPLGTALKHFGMVKNLLSFMTFRQNVGFDEVHLLGMDEKFGMLSSFAKMYVKNPSELTSKEMFFNIWFEDLGESAASLLSNFYNSTDKKPSYSLGFYPEKDGDATFMTNDKIRSICSGLECELEFIEDLTTAETQEILKLSKDVKKIIKEHRAGSNPLSQKTYDMIFSSIDHWSMSTSEKIQKLYNRYSQEMLILNHTSFHVEENAINEFVKYRNHITHGSYRVMDQKIAVTAHILSGLVYCCVLKRIGLDDEKILQLCKDGKIIR